MRKIQAVVVVVLLSLSSVNLSASPRDHSDRGERFERRFARTIKVIIKRLIGTNGDMPSPPVPAPKP